MWILLLPPTPIEIEVTSPALLNVKILLSSEVAAIASALNQTDAVRGLSFEGI
jgi:hypothetical protein